MDRWTIELVGDHVVARVDGDIDLGNGRDLVDFLGGLSALSECPVEVDLSGADFIDSSGLQALLAAHRLLLERDSTLSLVDPSPCARKVLELTGCTELFRVIQREVELPVAAD